MHSKGENAAVADAPGYAENRMKPLGLQSNILLLLRVFACGIDVYRSTYMLPRSGVLALGEVRR
jgi:hypothetical protein